jgi:hypothetical protein
MRPPGSTRIAASERPVQNPESPGAACTPGLRGGEWLPLVRSSVAAADQSFRRRACGESHACARLAHRTLILLGLRAKRSARSQRDAERAGHEVAIAGRIARPAFRAGRPGCPDAPAGEAVCMRMRVYTREVCPGYGEFAQGAHTSMAGLGAGAACARVTIERELGVHPVRSRVGCRCMPCEFVDGVLPQMAPWIKPAATKSVAALGKITLGVVALTCAYAGMERAMDDASAKPIEGTNKLKARKSGTW